LAGYKDARSQWIAGALSFCFGRPVMFAEIAMRRALHTGKPAPVRERRRKPGRT